MKLRGQLIGCLACGGGLVLMFALNYPMQRAQLNANKAGEGSRTIRQMAVAHAAKPEVKSFRYELGKGGDAGWKALGLTEDIEYHSFEGWVVGTGLHLTASGNLDRDDARSEWQWVPAMPSPQQIREDNRDECRATGPDGKCPALPTPPPAAIR